MHDIVFLSSFLFLRKDEIKDCHKKLHKFDIHFDFGFNACVVKILLVEETYSLIMLENSINQRVDESPLASRVSCF